MRINPISVNSQSFKPSFGDMEVVGGMSNEEAELHAKGVNINKIYAPMTEGEMMRQGLLKRDEAPKKNIFSKIKSIFKK